MRFIAGAKKCTIKQVSNRLTSLLKFVRKRWRKYLLTAASRSGVNYNWSIDNSLEFLKILKKANTTANNKKIEIGDFSTLYTKLVFSDITRNMESILDRLFNDSANKYLVYTKTGKVYFAATCEHSNNCYYDLDSMKLLVKNVVHSSYVTFAGITFKQNTGLPMGSSPAPIIADLVLSNMEFEFMRNKANKEWALKLKHTKRYVDDICSLNTNCLRHVANKIYPATLPLTFDNCSNGKGHYLDLDIDRNIRRHKMYDKRRDFSFEVIRFCHRDSNQPQRLGYQTFGSQLIRIARGTETKEDFANDCNQLLSQIVRNGFTIQELSKTTDIIWERYFTMFMRLNFRSKKELKQLIFKDCEL
jgi:hypothetical protein